MRHLAPLALLAFLGCGPETHSTSSDLAAPSDMLRLYDFSTRSDGGAPPDLSTTNDDLSSPDLSPPAPDFSLVDFVGADLSCAMPCTTAPAPDCAGQSVRTYTTPGACVLGMCQFPEATSPCQYGCFAGTCTGAFTGLSDLGAFQGQTSVGTIGGTASHTDGVSIVIRTDPHGSASAPHIVYSINDANFGNPTDAVTTFDTNQPDANNDQWYVIVPAQPAGTHVYYYLYADGYGGVGRKYYSNFGKNFDYSVN